jgi:hypothetical protein
LYTSNKPGEREKGNTKRELAKQDRLAKIRSQLEVAYEEWFVLGDKKKGTA